MRVLSTALAIPPCFESTDHPTGPQKLPLEVEQQLWKMKPQLSDVRQSKSQRWEANYQEDREDQEVQEGREALNRLQRLVS